MNHLLDGTVAPAPGGPEYGLLLGEQVIVGPGWACQAEVIGSAHGGYGNRMTGTLVVRQNDTDEWKEA